MTLDIQVICREPDDDRILARLARYLGEVNGWSVSDNPRASADLNYFIVYVDYAERFSDWHRTPTAAYFSHYEHSTPFKQAWWQVADNGIDLRIVTARQYGEMFSGKAVANVTPPVDPIFKPRLPVDSQIVGQLWVGSAGFIPPSYSGRKGASLVKQFNEEHGRRYTVVTSGNGWDRSLPGRLRSFDELPDWYGQLQIYLCTSLIEGIPMPPLEALACARPVVIPKHVGMLDDLPIMPGIARYDAGDYPGMVAAIESLRQLLERGLIPHAELPEAVAAYSKQAWATSHQVAFTNYLGGQQTAQPGNKGLPGSPVSQAPQQGAVAHVGVETDRHGQRGVVYVAYGGPARIAAESAVQTFKTHMPGIPAACISNQPLDYFDLNIDYPDADVGGRSAKTMIDSLAPRDWQQIMYLDADTEIVADISFLYNQLDRGFDMVICKNPGKYHTARQMVRSDNEDECNYTFNLLGTDELIQLNGGVFAYQRNERTQKFFALWHSEWQRYGKRDQAALLRSLFACPLRLLVLGNEWNTITRYDPPERSAGILHYPMTARRWRGVLHGRSDDVAAWQAVKEYEARNR